MPRAKSAAFYSVALLSTAHCCYRQRTVAVYSALLRLQRLAGDALEDKVIEGDDLDVGNALLLQGAGDIEDAAVIGSYNDLNAGLFDVLDLLGNNGVRDFWLHHREGTTKAAALFLVRQLDVVDVLELLEEGLLLWDALLYAQAVAADVKSHVKRCAFILVAEIDLQDVDKVLGLIQHTSAKTIDHGTGLGAVVRKELWVFFAHETGTGACWDDDRVVVIAKERDVVESDLFGVLRIAGIKGRLAAACLLFLKDNVGAAVL